jgi:hypothetical protein
VREPDANREWEPDANREWEPEWDDLPDSAIEELLLSALWPPCTGRHRVPWWDALQVTVASIHCSRCGTLLGITDLELPG